MLLLDYFQQMVFAPVLARQTAGILAALIVTTTANAQSLVVKELWRTNGGPETILFASVNGIGEAADGSIWISDSRAAQVLLLDSTLTTRLVARSGDGPGEVRGPSRMAQTPAGGLAIYDIGRTSIEFFGPEGTFERRVTLKAGVWNPKGFAVLPNGEFILSGGVPGAGYVPGSALSEAQYGIHRFSRSGDLIHSWWPIRKTKDPHAGVMVAGGPVASLPDGSVLFSDASPHQIIQFSADGAERRPIASNPDLLQAVGDEFIIVTGSGASRTTRYDWSFPQSRLIARLPSGEILNVVEFNEDGRTLFQLYALDGTPLTQTWVDTAYNPFFLTRNGDLLVRWTDPETDEQYVARLGLEYKR